MIGLLVILLSIMLLGYGFYLKKRSNMNSIGSEVTRALQSGIRGGAATGVVLAHQMLERGRKSKIYLIASVIMFVLGVTLILFGA